MFAEPKESKIEHTFLGKSGIKVSNLCLGCMTFGHSTIGYPGQLNEAESHKILDRYAEWGGNFLDTANVYGQGQSEIITGSWLAKHNRSDYVVATKVLGPMGPGPNDRGASRRNITNSIERSLERLQTNYLDLYQTHGWDYTVPIEETLRTMDDLVRAGKIRHFGVCNHAGWQMQKVVDVGKELGLNPCVSLQQQYSLLSRESEVEAFQVAQLNNIVVLPWAALRRGALSGKVKRNEMPKEGRVAFMDANKERIKGLWSDLDDLAFNVIEAAEAIGKAKSPQRTTAQVAIRWVLQRSVVGSVIIGARTLDQLEDNLGASKGWSLTKEEMETLEKVSAREPQYPHAMLNMFRQENPSLPSCFVKSMY